MQRDGQGKMSELPGNRRVAACRHRSKPRATNTSRGEEHSESRVAINSQHNLDTFLSEIVQYWTAIYPDLADHRKVQSTLKPILPQGCDHLLEDVPGCLTNARKRLGTER
jgi:hypothetical protein